MKNQIVYIVGIEGAGTSALARFYKERGAVVSGSDQSDGFYSSVLVDAGIEVFDTFDASHIPEHVDIAVRSTAFDETNEEVAELESRGCTVLTYPEALATLLVDHYGIAVSGTHGKTTTTGFLTHALEGAGLHPSAIVGAPVIGWSGGARVGTDKELIIEADEYQDKLALYNPQAAILTTCDFDHPDFFADFDACKDVFRAFVDRIPEDGILVANNDDQDVMDVIKNVTCRVITCGSTDAADVMIADRDQQATYQDVTVVERATGKERTITTSLPGPHNAFNAVIAWTLAQALTGDLDGCAKGIHAFKGTARRFEARGMYEGAVLIDDYAHHPEELRVALSTARELYPQRRLVVAFHPHTYSRTQALLGQFARTLEVADRALVTDIYASAREAAGKVHAQDLVNAVNQGVVDVAEYVPSLDDVEAWAQENLGENDIFLTCGAGDIWRVHDRLLDAKQEIA